MFTRFKLSRRRVGDAWGWRGLMLAGLLALGLGGLAAEARASSRALPSGAGGTSPGEARGELPTGLTAEEWGGIQAQIAAGRQVRGGAAASGPLAVSQQAYLKASNTGGNDYFGIALALDGDTLVVGAYLEDSNATGVNGNQADNSAGASGAAYVFVRSGGVWSQQAYLKASNTEPSDNFGAHVAISGDTIVVGAFGEDSSATGVNGNQADNSAGASGAAYVFVRSGGVWSQQAYLKASNPEADDNFGGVVAISGDTIVVGATGEDSSATGINGNGANNGADMAGAAYVFTRSGGLWSQQAYLKASNTELLDFFGRAVTIEGDTIVVGASGEDSSATGVNGSGADNGIGDSGAAYVFTRSGGVWSQQAYLKASNTGPNDTFGNSLDLSGESLVIGAPGEGSSATGVNGDQLNNSAPSSGAAYVFTRSGGLWSQQAYLKASNTEVGDSFGWVAISGDRVLVGSQVEASSATGINGDQANNNAPGSGAAYLYTRSGGNWGAPVYIKASNTNGNDNFAASVALDAETVVVGAFGEGSDATGINGDQANNRAPSSGAAYVFLDLAPTALTLTHLDSATPARGLAPLAGLLLGLGAALLVWRGRQR